MSEELSDFQKRRLENIKRNNDLLKNKFIILDSAILFKIFLSMVWLPFLQKKRRKKNRRFNN